MELYKRRQVIEVVTGKKLQGTGHVARAKKTYNIKIEMEMEGKRRRADGLIVLRVCMLKKINGKRLTASVKDHIGLRQLYGRNHSSIPPPSPPWTGHSGFICT